MLEPPLRISGDISIVNQGLVKESPPGKKEEGNSTSGEKNRVYRGWSRSPYWALLKEDTDLQRWYDNVCRGSKLTASVYLRRLGFLCSTRALRPHDLVLHARSDEQWAYNFLMDLVTELENQGKAGSYIQSNMKAVKSWLSHNEVQVVGKIKIRGENDTPSLKNKHAPTSSEFAVFFSNAPPQTRCAGALVAQAGLVLKWWGTTMVPTD